MLDLLTATYPAELSVASQARDGDLVAAGGTITRITGRLPLLLGIERTLLNFLQRLCGVATLTRQYVDAVAGTGAKIYDTRKTVPGWRQLDKYAVRCGGGCNHRMGLHDAVLVKDNHLAGSEIGGLASPGRLAVAAFEILNRSTDLKPPPDFIEFEVDTLEQLDELFKVVGIDVILLDNFTPEKLREAVKRRDGLGLKEKVALEASGGVQLYTARAMAESGVDRIAVGAITHSAPALDLAMEIKPA